MADDPTYRWNWKPITQGNTRPGTNFTETSSTSALTAVEVRLKLPDSTVADITLTSADGITINSATAGAWDFDIDEIPAATTDGYTPGIYSYEMDVTESSGTVTTILKGSWEIFERIQDAP